MADFEYVDVNGRQIRVRPRETAQEIDEYGNFHRQPNRFTEGFGEGKNPVEKDRYILFWAKGCNWSNRAAIARELLGLEDAVKVEIVDWTDREENLGWEFVNSPDHINPETGAQFLSELYYNADEEYTGRTTVPAFVDYKTKKVVNNDYHWLTNHLETAFRPFHKKGAPDLYPEELRPEIDKLNKWLFENVNNAVYRAQFAESLQAFADGYETFFAGLDAMEERLADKKGIIGEDGVIRSAGKAVLGADDVAGLVEILEGIRSVKEAGVPHRDIEILFTIAEELYIKGSSVFDFSKVRAKEAYVLDISGPVGSAAYKAPSLISYQVVVTGKASHAGFDPEHGVHAIAIASEAITQISQGHVDEETTCNIGLIEGGSGTNIVPEKCIVKGEIRSYSHEKATRCVEEVGNTFKKVAEKHGAESELTCEVHLIAYETAKDSVPVKRFERVSKELGLAGELVETFGGSDNNSFAKNGIPGLVLSNGMYQAHSVNEYTTIKDLVTGVELIAGLITDVQ